MITAARTERGWSQAQLADALAQASGRGTLDRHYVSRWERGDRAPGSFWLPYLAEVIGLDLAELKRATRERGRAEPPCSTVLATRREVVGYIGATLVGASFFSPGMITSLSTAILGIGQSKFAPGRAELVELSELTVRVEYAWSLRQQAAYVALTDHLIKLIPDVELAVRHLDGDEKVTATTLMVHTYNTASSLLKRVGEMEVASVSADRAVRAADSLDDTYLSAAANYRLANVLLAAARLDGARQVVVQAADSLAEKGLSTPLGLASWGGLLLTGAVACARMGDVPGAWELFGEARAASRILRTDYADIHTIFGPTNVAIHGVQIAAELGDGRDAVARGKQVDAERLPLSLSERRGQFYIDLARGHSMIGSDGAAAATLLQAENVASEEVRLNPTVHHLVDDLLSRERVGATPGLRDLAQRIGLNR
jgi:transcriptional regulator with XRE-family HTH domain